MSRRPEVLLSEPGLLCQGCGYALEGLQSDGNCPECEQPVASSVPFPRSGSLWQQGPGVRSWLRTVWHVCTAPSAVARDLDPWQQSHVAVLFLLNVVAIPWTTSVALLSIIGVAEAFWPAPDNSYATGFILALLALVHWATIIAWLVLASIAAVVCGVALRISYPWARILRTGRAVLIAHGSCVLAPVSLVIFVAALCFGPDPIAARGTVLAAVAVGLLWLAWVSRKMALTAHHAARPFPPRDPSARSGP